jgi:FKBP12-rapamycin complex-associated protein
MLRKTLTPTLEHRYGNHKSVDEAFKRGVYTVPVYTWLGVVRFVFLFFFVSLTHLLSQLSITPQVPQLLARLHLVRNNIRLQLMELLSRIGAENPQALIFPLTVACKSPLKSRQVTASTILESTRREWPTLVEHAELVSAECVRVAVLWEEQWHGALEEAWRQHYHEKNPEGAVEVLMPLHEKVENPGPQTGQEAAFEHRYGEILRRAFKSLNKYMSTKDTQFLHQAWGLYVVFEREAREFQ